MEQKSKGKKYLITIISILLANSTLCEIFRYLSKSFSVLIKTPAGVIVLLVVADIFIYWFIFEYPEIKDLEKSEKKSKIFYQINWFGRRNPGILIWICLVALAFELFWFH